MPQISSAGPDFPLSGGLLTIDLAALADNYRGMVSMAAPARVAAVVKADAYGLGIAAVVPALMDAGCRDFFVALPHEGAVARAVAKDARIFVLSGPLDAESAPYYRRHRLTPVLNTPHEIVAWEAEGWDGDTQLPAALHVDTGMNRLGLSLPEAIRFAEENSLTGAIKLCLVMSHFAIAEQAQAPVTLRQVEVFQQIGALFSDVETSLSSSGGAALGPLYTGDLVRAGIALYGGSVGVGAPALLPVAKAEARILQIRRVPAGAAVGYGEAETLQRDSLIATVAVGYADGYHRALSGAGVALRADGSAGAMGFLNGRTVPVVGRVSMDLTVFDVTDVGDVSAGDMIELFGPNIELDEVAAAGGTIGYELLTSLGRRYHRAYLRGDR